MRGAFRLQESAFLEMVRHAEETYPEECCGILLEEEDGTQRVYRCRNIQNELHAADPEKYPRDARTAYVIDPQDLLRASHEADRTGARFAAFYHSHPDHGAYFSAEDRRQAVSEEWGEPFYPETCYLILSVQGGKFAALKAFDWDPDRVDFVEVPVRREPDPTRQHA